MQSVVSYLAHLLWRWRLAIFLVCCTALSYGLFRTEPPPELFRDSDKAFHVAAFMVFALSARLAFSNLSGWLIWPLLLALAPLSEWLQHYLQPTRQFSLGDIQANLAGMALACLISLAVKGLWLRRPAQPPED